VIDPIRRTITVTCDPATAFRVFTDEMATWWPLDMFSRSVDEGGAPVTSVVFDHEAGGAIWEVRSRRGYARLADLARELDVTPATLSVGLKPLEARRLVAHDDLDYGPIAATPVEFRNLVTGRTEPVAGELVELTRVQVQKGNWPWKLYCGREAKLKPVFPSSLALVSPADSELVGVAMHCPSCGDLSLNVVSEAHLDVPFYHDRVVRLIDRPFLDSRDLTVDDFHERLWSAGFDAERARLAS